MQHRVPMSRLEPEHSCLSLITRRPDLTDLRNSGCLEELLIMLKNLIYLRHTVYQRWPTSMYELEKSEDSRIITPCERARQLRRPDP